MRCGARENCSSAGSRRFGLVSTLAERLGYDPDAKLVIINCDDLGSTRSANVAIYEAQGIATSATLMVPCPWARDAAAMYRGEDVGVHLTLNAEWDTYRWGPITHSPSHMGTMQLRADFFDVYLELAVDFRLPLRMAGASGERMIGFAYRRVAEEEGVVFPDHFVYTHVGSKRAIERTLFDLRPGVTEMYLHPAIDTDELRVSHPDWAQRVEDHAYLTSDASLRDLVERSGAILIGYRELRELQRRAPAPA